MPYASACCTQVALDRNVAVTLVYRRRADVEPVQPIAIPISEQSYLLPLPTTSPGTVHLAFDEAPSSPYDRDNDGAKNQLEWCSGTLLD